MGEEEPPCTVDKGEIDEMRDAGVEELCTVSCNSCSDDCLVFEWIFPLILDDELGLPSTILREGWVFGYDDLHQWRSQSLCFQDYYQQDDSFPILGVCRGGELYNPAGIPASTLDKRIQMMGFFKKRTTTQNKILEVPLGRDEGYAITVRLRSVNIKGELSAPFKNWQSPSLLSQEKNVAELVLVPSKDNGVMVSHLKSIKNNNSQILASNWNPQSTKKQLTNEQYLASWEVPSRHCSLCLEQLQQEYFDVDKDGWYFVSSMITDDGKSTVHPECL
ncbi:unnamed protein product [Lepeophtheirus salmonis]|uniref:(salmon louse) hypothetical protein n=1 Tax=Lepeophtheirus salmonis TaxID=72036 RepID=A0A7R8H1J5_LEPSM|nr:unnamed protein product [Lepeophtheirus salmonis]CAF2812646.1 unnamed protein product [Lepeophtheirus salmonis]